MQRTCDHFLWVDDRVTIEEKRSFITVDRELRKMRSKFLTATATLRICQESEKFFKSQWKVARRAEMLWMAICMMTVVMYMVHVTIVK